MDPQRWDERYSEEGYSYGTEPNEFLASVAAQIPTRPVLMLGEGEGRNAAFLVGLGCEVVAVDQSAVGLAKARRLAAERGARVRTHQADLRDYPIEPGAWAGVVSVFCHLPPAVRIPLHAALVRGLKPGGVFDLGAYTPRQLGRRTGGPSDPQMMPPLDVLLGELAGLEFVHALELERELRE